MKTVPRRDYGSTTLENPRVSHSAINLLSCVLQTHTTSTFHFETHSLSYPNPSKQTRKHTQQPSNETIRTRMPAESQLHFRSHNNSLHLPTLYRPAASPERNKARIPESDLRRSHLTVHSHVDQYQKDGTFYHSNHTPF